MSFNLLFKKCLNIVVMNSVGIITDLQRSTKSFLFTVGMGSLAYYTIDSLLRIELTFVYLLVGWLLIVNQIRACVS